MAEFTTVVKERNRMCNHFDMCHDCPLDTFSPCRNWVIDHPEEAERVVMEWSKKNPVVTNRMKLKEVFGFDVAVMFEDTTANCLWLNSEYVDKKKEV